MRGKYAAQAENRRVNLDNQLLQQTTAERDAAKARIHVLEAQLHALSLDTTRRARELAAELAGADIARLEAEVADLQRQQPLRDEELFRGLMKLYGGHHQVPMLLLSHIAELFGCTHLLGDSLVEHILPTDALESPRKLRRRASKGLRVLRDPSEQRRRGVHNLLSYIPSENEKIISSGEENPFNEESGEESGNTDLEDHSEENAAQESTPGDVQET